MKAYVAEQLDASKGTFEAIVVSADGSTRNISHGAVHNSHPVFIVGDDDRIERYEVETEFMGNTLVEIPVKDEWKGPEVGKRQ